MENEEVMSLIETLYTMISEAWGVPLGNDKCIVERDKALEILDEIKAVLPVELAEAKRLVSAKDEFISNAKREAESVRRLSEEKARTMVEEQEIVRVARARSMEMMTNAQAKSEELKRLASQYADDVLRTAEDTVTAAMNQLHAQRAAFRSAAGAAAQSDKARIRTISQDELKD